jgi:hypothetical protein
MKLFLTQSMRRILRSLLLSFVGVSLLTPVLATAEYLPPREEFPEKRSNYSPYADRKTTNRSFAEGLYWGDTHLHTTLSADSGLIGNVLPPEDAYRFARGETVTSSSGQRTRLVRPLDFLVVADHAQNLGLPPMLEEGNPLVLNTETGKRWYDMKREGKDFEAFVEWTRTVYTEDPINQPKMISRTWERQIDTAEKYNEPGVFTALIGFEWTSMNTLETPSNLHRVVIFRDGADKASEVIPFSVFDSPDPEDLWKYLQSYEDSTGGDVLAIPHNGNLSNGLMFDVERLNGRPINKAYAETRAQWEPIVEVTQIKGDGEAHPFLSPNDEFADYGSWDFGDILLNKPNQNDMLAGEYARSALQRGLQLEAKLGINPYKFGMIGSTDTHTSLATTREENFFGKFPASEPAADRYTHLILENKKNGLAVHVWQELASGLAGVWAKENTREALFDAMERKEVYATTGTRITVRLFGGWDYAPDDVFRSNAVEIGYDKGVPMGGDLSARPTGAKGPVFIVGALKDAWSGNLDRIQIIKGWVDEKGNSHERIYDVAVSDGRTIGSEGRVTKPVGNTVNLKDASFLNTIGDSELRAVWEDPDFDPNHRAVYYARVLEIPTPTWQAYDAVRYSVDMPEEVPMVHQERAYTSPIWYTP